MKMILLDRNENWIGNVQGAIIAERQAEINGHDLLLLETLSELEKGQRIVYQDEQNYWHEYIVREVKKRHDSGLQYSIYCESSFYELLGDYIEDKRPTNTTATAALSIALEPTRWQVGQVDNLGLHSTNFYQISAKEAVSKIAEVWKGEIRTRITVVGNQITGRYVDLKSLIGNDLGKRFSYDKDMHAITKTVARADVITALYGYGRGEEVGDGYGRRLRFGEINDGVDYVENLDAKAIWGRLNPDGSRSHVFGKEIFDDIEDMVELKAKTEDKLVELSQPMISYTADVLDLKAAGFDHEGVGLGDTCLIIDKEFEPELRISGRVIAVIEDLIGKRKTITLGNYLPIITDSISKQEAFINSFRARSSVWDRSGAFDEDGNLSTNFIDGAIDVLKHQLLSVQSGWYTDDNGNLVLDATNGESSMMLSGAGFMIANTKLPNGEWDYRTFGTGDGFTADMIIAGALVGGNVAWNLEDGTLLIGESTEDYQLYFDGTDLHFGEGVAVTWSTLSGKPTYLGSDRISSPEIYGGNIYGGNIYGGTITSGTTITGASIQTTDGNIGGFEITPSGLRKSIYRTFGPFTTADVNTVQQIMLSGVQPSQSQLNKYDMHGLGYFNSWTTMEINRMATGLLPNPKTVEYVVEINANSRDKMVRVYAPEYLNLVEGTTVGISSVKSPRIISEFAGNLAYSAFSYLDLDTYRLYDRSLEIRDGIVIDAHAGGYRDLLLNITNSVSATTGVTSVNARALGKVVTIRFLYKPTSTGFIQNVITMPVGYRPPTQVAIAIATTQTTADAATNIMAYLGSNGSATVITSGTLPTYELLFTVTYIAL